LLATLFEGDFGSWTFGNVAASGSSATGTVLTSGGHPDVCIQATTVTGTGAWATAMNRGVSWNPATDGAITTVQMALDVKSVSGWGQGQNLQVFVEQAGQLYGAPGYPGVGTGSSTSWHTVTKGVFSADSFSKVTEWDPRNWDTAAHPDFSSQGSSLTFGFAVANSISGTYTQLYDNWSLTVTADPPSLVVSTLADEIDGDYRDGDLSLREALLLASQRPGDDVITFKDTLRAGTITLAAALGQLVIDSNVDIQGLGMDQLTVRGSGQERVFGTLAGATLTVESILVTGNSATWGGGIGNKGTLTLRDAIVCENTATDGAGIANRGHATIVQGDFLRNEALSLGGGVYTDLDSVLTATRCVISDNTSGILGGGLFVSDPSAPDNSATLTDVTVSGNAADSGGGVYNMGRLTLRGCAVYGNQAIPGTGGGICNQSIIDIADATISGNSARDGGGIHQVDGSLTLTNVTVAENVARNSGGGISTSNGVVMLSNSIVADNSRLILGGPPEPCDVQGAFDFNSPGYGNSSNSYNLIGVGDGATGLDGPGNRIGTCASPLDPKLGPLADNGGRTLTHALLAGSPAVDAGSNTRAADAGLATDQRGDGYPRILDGDRNGTATVDIGAYEATEGASQAPWTVMVYLDGDNDLERYAIDDFLALASVGSTSDVNIVVQLDRAESSESWNDIRYGDWTDSRWGLVQAGDVPDDTWGMSLGEANMAGPGTLTAFINRATAAYPARKYALILWDHGAGCMEGILHDYDRGDGQTILDSMTDAEVRQALGGVSANIDLFCYDACLMGMVECAYELTWEATIFVGSERPIPTNASFRLPLDSALGNLVAHPEWHSAEWAQSIVRDSAWKMLTLSAAKIGDVGTLTEAISDLATVAIGEATPNDRQRLREAWISTNKVTNDFPYRDLGRFLELVSDDSAITGSLRTAAESALAIYEGAILANQPGDTTGLSIYFPGPGDSIGAFYDRANLLFVRDTQWKQFLEWFGATSLGPVTCAQMSGLDPSSGDLACVVETSRAGTLTIETSDADTTLTLTHMDSADPPVTSSLVDGRQRIDVEAGNAGEAYHVRLQGNHGGVTLRLANLVSRNGAAASVFGTAEIDQFQFDATGGWFAINDFVYRYQPWGVDRIEFDGAGGKDVATLTCSAGDEYALLYPDRGTIKGPGYLVALTSIEHKTVYAGGGAKDIVTISGSNGADTFTAGPTEGVVITPGYSTRVVGFENVSTTARSGADKAIFSGFAGADTFVGRPTYSNLFGSGFYVAAQEFDEVAVQGTPGDADAAYFTDTPGNEAVIADPSQATMTGGTFKYTAIGFDKVFAIARSDGFDTAQLTDGPGNDTFDAYPDYATLHGPGFWIQAKYFDEVKAYGTTGGINTANFFDSAGNDTFEARYAETKTVTYRADNHAYDFLVANAFGYNGGVDTAHLHGTSGNDTFKFYSSASPMYGRLTAKIAGGVLYDRVAKAFDNVYAYGEDAGTDIAWLYDSANDDTFTGKPDESRLSGSGFLAVAKAFDEVHAQASNGTDTAELNDSEWDDALDATTTSIKLSSNNSYRQYLYEVLAFDSVTAKSTTGRDTKNIASGVDNLELLGIWE